MPVHSGGSRWPQKRTHVARIRRTTQRWLVILLSVLALAMLVYEPGCLSPISTYPPSRQVFEASVAQLKTVAIAHTRWRGIRAAARAHGIPLLQVYTIAGPKIIHIVSDLKDKEGLNHVVLHGGLPGLIDFCFTMKDALPDVQVSLVYHGSVTQQVTDEADVRAFDAIMVLLDQGKLDKVGFVKADQHMDVKDGVKMTSVSHLPNVPSAAMLPRLRLSAFAQNTVHIGIWAVEWWRKNFVSQLMAACSIPNAVIHTGCVSCKHSTPLTAVCANPVQFHSQVTPARALDLVQRMDLNLYSSHSECDPMVPLESMQAGVPCILAPTSDTLSSNVLLSSRLTANATSRPEVIAEAAVEVIKAQSSSTLLSAFSDLLLNRKRTSQAKLEQFLGLPAESVSTSQSRTNLELVRSLLPATSSPRDIERLVSKALRHQQQAKTHPFNHPVCFCFSDRWDKRNGEADMSLLSTIADLDRSDVSTLLVLDVATSSYKQKWRRSVPESTVVLLLSDIIRAESSAPWQPPLAEAKQAIATAAAVRALTNQLNCRTWEFPDFGATASALLILQWLEYSHNAGVDAQVPIVVHGYGTHEAQGLGPRLASSQPPLATAPRERQLSTLERTSLKLADYVVVSSEHEAAMLENAYQLPKVHQLGPTLLRPSSQRSAPPHTAPVHSASYLGPKSSESQRDTVAVYLPWLPGDREPLSFGPDADLSLQRLVHLTRKLELGLVLLFRRPDCLVVSLDCYGTTTYDGDGVVGKRSWMSWVLSAASSPFSAQSRPARAIGNLCGIVFLPFLGQQSYAAQELQGLLPSTQVFFPEAWQRTPAICHQHCSYHDLPRKLPDLGGGGGARKQDSLRPRSADVISAASFYASLSTKPGSTAEKSLLAQELAHVLTEEEED